jgi:hypothetical protein
MEDKTNSEPRQLTAEELALLSWLLEHGLPEAKTFAPQVEKIRATPWCDCGCPSISLHVGEDAPLGISSYSPIADFVGTTQGGKRVGLLLFQKDGKLDLLEEYELDVIEGTWGFPVIDSLEAWQKAGRSFQKVDGKWVALS